MSLDENKFAVKTILDKIYQWMKNYNLFEHSYTDEHTRRNELLSSRLFVLSMIIGSLTITFYSSIVQHTVTYYVKLPSIDKYRQLVNQYPSLMCECQQTTTSYSVFVSFAPAFHQICSSLYAQTAFTVHYGNITDMFFLGRFSYSVTMTTLVGAIPTLCSKTKRIVSESILTYLETTYLSTYLTHEDEFISSVNISINNLKTSLPARISHFFQLLRNIVHGNQLLSSVFSNAKIQYNTSSIADESKINLLWLNSINESCNCGASSDSCTVFYDDYCNHTYTYQFTDACPFPGKGIAISCDPYDACLFSTMECFFDPVCADIV